MRGCLVRQARHAIDAGVDVVQVREPDLEAGALAALVWELVALARGRGPRIVVNERLDVALACGANGVHLRADSMPAAAVRSMVPAGFLVGRSVHGMEEAVAVAPSVDYLIAGTVFPSGSKPGGPLIGVAGLSAIARAVRVPVLAIGGVTLDRMAELGAAGAAGVAAIGLFMQSAAGGCGAAPLGDIVRTARARFDTPRSPS
jgi:thiamine-phosphate pyrophosphorylase